MKHNEEAAAKRAALKRRFTVSDEGRLYFVLQLVFCTTQLLLAYVAFGEANISRSGVIIFALFGIVMMLIAGKWWNKTSVRVFTRVLAAAVVGLFLIIIGIEVVTTQVLNANGTGFVTRSFSDYIGQLANYLCRFIQALVLMLVPTLAIASRRQDKRIDILALRISSFVLIALAIITLLLSYESSTRLVFYAEIFGIGNRVLLIAYLICTIATSFAVYMSHPFGVRWIQSKIEKARRKTDTEQTTESET